MAAKASRNNLYFIVSATLMGNTLEWYDYATFGLFIPLFSQLFFPNGDPFSGTFKTLLVYVVGSGMRIVGGVLFGYIGDRWGRNISLISSVALMTLPLCVIGFLPTYAQIGIAAPLILTAMRTLQGIAAGGEFPEIMVYIVESSPIHQRIFLSSFSFFGIFLGLAVGVIDYFLIDLFFPKDILIQWGWRLPFFLSIVAGLVTFYLRSKLHETPIYQKSKEHSEIVKNPFKELFKSHKRGLSKVFGLVILETVAFNQIVIFLTIYLTQYLGVSIKLSLLFNFILLGSMLVLLPAMGKAGNRWGSPLIAHLSLFGFLLFSFPLFFLLNREPLAAKISALFGLAVLLAGYMAMLPDYFRTLFPVSVRCSGIGIGYNLAIALIGAPSLLLSIYFMQKFQNPLIPAYCLIAAAALSLPVLLSIKKRIADPF